MVSVLRVTLYVVAIILLFIILYLIFKKSPEKYYRKASKSHKKGEEFYLLGDFELANDYYEAAERYRLKAEKLKGE